MRSRDRFNSPFYPPRAGWGSRPHYWWISLRESLRLRDPVGPWGLTPGALLLAVIVPGRPFRLTARPGVATQVLWGWLAAAGLFLVALGTWVATLAGCAMFALHSLGLSILAEPWTAHRGLWGRWLGALVLTGLVAALVYRPVQWTMERHLFFPVQVHGRGFVVTRWPPASRVARDDVVFYRLPSWRAPGYWFGGGVVFGRVEGMPGETVEFRDGFYTVAGQRRRARPSMPLQGGFTVPENHWFIWPDSGMNLPIGRDLGPESAVQRMLLDLCLAPRESYAGRACRWWFIRPMPLP